MSFPSAQTRFARGTPQKGSAPRAIDFLDSPLRFYYEPLICVPMLLIWLLTPVATACRPRVTASAMNTARKAYSMRSWPWSSRTKRAIRFFTMVLLSPESNVNETELDDLLTANLRPPYRGTSASPRLALQAVADTRLYGGQSSERNRPYG